MFEKKDYIAYMKEILKMEHAMKKEGILLMKAIADKNCQILLEKLVSDEKRHVELVKNMTQAIVKNKI